jgi:osmoprotectant transport system permease protein
VNEQLYSQLLLLPTRLGWHLLLVTVALVCGIAISVPLAILCTRYRRLEGPALAVAGIIQTIPSLALLAAAVLALGTIGFLPAFIALVLYAILPILRNTVTGIAGVDRALIEAALGVGMTDRQILLQVQMPLAAPIIIAGIRTSAIWLVGIATLSTPVGQMSLGDYIFQGLQLRNQYAVLVGCVAAAAVALAIDGLILLMEVSSRRRSRPMAGLALVGVLILLGGGISPLLRTRADTIVGAKTFSEQYTLAYVLSNQLSDAGFNVARQQGMGSSILFDSLASGAIDVCVDYTGTIWTNVMKRTDTTDSDTMLEEVTAFLKQKYGIVVVGPLGFENAYALAMPKDKAEAQKIKSIADLALHSRDMTIGGDYEFFGRPEWKAVVDAYGLHFKDKVSLDSTLMYEAARLDKVDAIAAFSTDGRILAYNLRVLKDPKNAFPPYDAVILVSPRAAKRPGLIDALKPLVGSISDNDMRRANKWVDLDHVSPKEAARRLLPPG